MYAQFIQILLANEYVICNMLDSVKSDFCGLFYNIIIWI